MADLFQHRRDQARQRVAPLALRMRPRTLDEVVGQQHILAPGKLLRRMLEADRLTSVILHGPPGTGKTTLAELIAQHSRALFVRENAAMVGVARIRQIIDDAARRIEEGGSRTILFLDEVHRFSRSQQDVLLGDVERGTLTLIGATTENPLFAVNSALVSRSTLFRLEPLSTEDVLVLLRRAIADRERGFGALALRVHDEALALLANRCEGDARRALGALEVAVESQRAQRPTGAEEQAIVIDDAIAQDSIQQRAMVYDAAGDQHYDHASALIKSLRGSDPDAALYWMARMLESGEDPRFIARRLAILASEDVGNADPRALMLAAAAYQVVERVGMPEARITLAQLVTYLALAPKSNASYTAIEAALDDVRNARSVAVPVAIKDRNVRRGQQLGGGAQGEGYRYTHTDGADHPHLGKVGVQDYLPVSREYYQPTQHGLEKQLAQLLADVRALRAKAGDPPA